MKKLLIVLATLSLTATPFIGLGLSSKHQSNLTNSSKNITNKPNNNQQLGGKKLNPEYFTKNTSVPNNVSLMSMWSYNGILYGGSKNNGLYESVDQGQTFTQNKSIPTNSGIFSIYSYNNVIYVVLNKSGLLYESFDNGSNFKQVNSIPPFEGSIYGYNDVVYAGTENGLYESFDNGKTWMQNTYIPTGCNVFIIRAYNGVVYVGNDGLYESSDNGKTFARNDSIPIGNVTPLQSVESIYYYQKTVYVTVVNTLSGKDGLYESSDNGATFTQNNSIPSTSGATYTYAYNNTIYVGTSQNGLYESTDDGESFHTNFSIPSGGDVEQIYAYNDVLYVLVSGQGLYESFDQGTTFTQNMQIPSTNCYVRELYGYNNVVYVLVDNMYSDFLGLYESNFYINSLNDFWNYQEQINTSQDNIDGLTLFYKQTQNIILKNNPAVASYVINGKSYTPGNHVSLNNNQFQPNTVEIHLKNPADASKYPLGNPQTGVVKFYIQIQDALNQQPTYKALNSDTNLYSGLVGNSGNIDKWNIYQTVSKAPNAPIQFNNTNVDYLDLSKSYYVSGSIDSNNNFNATGVKTNVIDNINNININGIYQIHLEDIFGNTYNSLLELGKSNWKAKGTFNDDQLAKLEKELNVSSNLRSVVDKQTLLKWLTDYQTYVQSQGVSLFNQEKTKLGHGFNYTKLQQKYNSISTLTSYLKNYPINITDIAHLPSYQDNWKKNVTPLITRDIDTDLNNANSSDWNDEVTKNQKLASLENVSVDKSKTQQEQDWNSDLNKYNQFLTDYKRYLDNNSKTIVDQEINKFDLGYMTPTEQTKIENDILSQVTNGGDIQSKYLTALKWNPQTADTFQEFKSLINMQAIDQEIEKDLNAESPNPHQQLANDIANAEKGVNLYGFTVNQILQHYNKQLPQNKQQITNFDGKGTSFHNWLAQNALNYHNETKNSNTTKTILAAVFGTLGGIAIITGFALLYKNRWSAKARQKGLPEPDNKPSNWKKMSREAKIAHLKSEGWGHFEESEQEK